MNLKKTPRIFFGTAIITIIGIIAIVLINNQRPTSDVARLSSQEIKAAGSCIQCHRRSTPGLVKLFLESKHFQKGVSCLDCHKPLKGQKITEHKGFEITLDVTSGNCKECHSDEYNEFERSRHAGPAWTAVKGHEPFTDEQKARMVSFHPDAWKRGPNKLGLREGSASIESGCTACHSIGKPNVDGSVGNCSACHLRHDFSIKTPRVSQTCGSCHLGPDHSQIEIWEESAHGIMFKVREDKQDLTVPSDELTVEQNDSPTCSTCHMSGLGKSEATHDVGARLSWYLYPPISTKREGSREHRLNMKKLCSNCHEKTKIDNFYKEADAVVLETNEKVQRTKTIYAELKKDGLLTKKAFDEDMDFLYFDHWHYFGRTAKHGAFMGGADFVQWHGNYELLRHEMLIEKENTRIRSEAGNDKQIPLENGNQ